MKLTLLRHGITEGNRSQLCYGSTDLPLLEEGIAALKAAVQTMDYPTAVHYYTSGMRRTEQTFALLYGDTPHEVLSGLRELDFGRFEMIPCADLKDDPDYRRWADDSTGQEVCPGGESFGQVYVRAIADLTPVLERGEDAVSRHEKVERFFATGELDTKSNVQFGEGGAGTFSDGKLNTGVNNPRIGWILEQFVAAGAREDILFDAKPHVGTDILLTVVQNIRRRIVSLGGEVRFNTQVTGLRQENGRLTALEVNGAEWINCSDVILAIGHSARDTFEMLLENGIPMEPKPFSMGVRIEHKQSMVNAAQYGLENVALPPADYKLVRHLENETVYTFCMCPGGYVVAAASEEGRVVTNGMSYADRDGENANAALLVTLNPADFPYDGVLGGVQWQREIEEKAFRASGSYRAPAQLVGDFLERRTSIGPGSVQPTYRPGVAWCDLHDVLPGKITGALEQAIPELERNLKGFASPDAVLTAPETRSSSPVRIVRDERRQSALGGIYPAGEGAGYAGGIMSAAIDGMLSAEALIEALEG